MSACTYIAGSSKRHESACVEVTSAWECRGKRANCIFVWPPLPLAGLHEWLGICIYRRQTNNTDRHISTPLSLSRDFIRLNEFCLTLSASPLSLGGVPPTDALFTLETEIHNGKVMYFPLYHPRRQMRFQNRELKTLWGYVKVTVPYDQVLSPNSPVIKLGIQTLRNKEIMLHWFLTTHWVQKLSWVFAT